MTITAATNTTLDLGPARALPKSRGTSTRNAAPVAIAMTPGRMNAARQLIQ